MLLLHQFMQKSWDFALSALRHVSPSVVRDHVPMHVHVVDGATMVDVLLVDGRRFNAGECLI